MAFDENAILTLAKDFHEFDDRRPWITMRIRTPNRQMGPQDIWDYREFWLQKEENSFNNVWSELVEEDRKVVVRMVEDSLKELINHVEDWVPYAFIGEGGDFLNINFLVVFGQVEKERWLQEIERTENLKRAKSEIGPLIRELEEAVEEIA